MTLVLWQRVPPSSALGLQVAAPWQKPVFPIGVPVEHMKHVPLSRYGVPASHEGAVLPTVISPQQSLVRRSHVPLPHVGGVYVPHTIAPSPPDDEPLSVASPPSVLVASLPASEDPEPLLEEALLPELEPLELEPPELDDAAASAPCPSAPPESLAVPEPPPPLELEQATATSGATSAAARSTARRGLAYFEPRLCPDILDLPFTESLAPPR